MSEEQRGSITVTLRMVPDPPRPHESVYFMGNAPDDTHMSFVLARKEWKTLGEPTTLEATISLPQKEQK